MKKNRYKLSDLINRNINYPNSNYIKASTLIETYLESYKQSYESIGSIILSCDLGPNYKISYKADQNKKIYITIKDTKKDKEIELDYDFTKVDDIKLFNSNCEENSDDIEEIKGKLLTSVKKFALEYEKELAPYDKLHNGIYSINSGFSLYFIDEEIVLFVNSNSYIDFTINENNEIVPICCNMDLMLQAAILSNLDKILDNVYFDISDAPEFLQSKLFALREVELSNQPSIDVSNKPFSRIRKLFS